MSILDELKVLKTLLIEKDKIQDKFNHERSNKETIVYTKTTNYQDYKTYYRMTVKLRKFFLGVSTLISIWLIAFIVIPFFYDKYPGHTNYEYIGIPAIIIVVLCLLSSIRSYFKNYEELVEFNLSDYVKMKFEHITIQLGVSCLIGFGILAIFIAAIFFEPSETFTIIVNEAWYIAVLNALVLFSFFVIVELISLILLPLVKICIHILPKFKKERKSIDRSVVSSSTSRESNLYNYHKQLDRLRKKIRDINVISYEYKKSGFVADLINHLESNPKINMRLALNQVIIRNKIHFYNSSVKQQNNIAELKVKNSIADIEYDSIEYKASVRTYNKILSQTNAKLSYIKDQTNDEIQRYIDNHKK